MQSDAAREVRLRLAEENVHVEDEHTGGQLNANWQIQKNRKQQEKQDKLKNAQPAGPQLTVIPVTDATNEVRQIFTFLLHATELRALLTKNLLLQAFPL